MGSLFGTWTQGEGNLVSLAANSISFRDTTDSGLNGEVADDAFAFAEALAYAQGRATLARAYRHVAQCVYLMVAWLTSKMSSAFGQQLVSIRHRSILSCFTQVTCSPRHTVRTSTTVSLLLVSAPTWARTT